MAISMLKIRRPLGRLIFNMGIAIPGKTVFLIETAPRWYLQFPWNNLHETHKNAHVHYKPHNPAIVASELKVTELGKWTAAKLPFNDLFCLFIVSSKLACNAEIQNYLLPDGSLGPTDHDPYGSQSTGNVSHHWCFYLLEILICVPRT